MGGLVELFVQRKDFVCGTGRDGRPREPTRWNIALLGLRVAEGLADVHQHLRGGAARAVAGALRHHEVSNRERKNKKKTSSSLTANKPPTTTTSRHLKSDIVTVGFGGVMGMAAFLMCSGESSAPTSRTPFSFLCVCVCVCVCLAHGPTGYLVALKLISLSLSLFPKRTCVCVCVCVEQNNQAPRARGFRWPTPGS